MNKGIKGLIITGSILVGVGLTIATVGFATNGFNFTSFAAKYNDRAEEFTEDFNNIKVDEKISNISLVYYGGEKCKVEFHEIEYETHTCEIKDGVLTVKTEDARNWWTFKFGTNSAKTTIYLPKTTYVNAELKTNTGDITVNSDLSFNSVKANTDTGDIIWKAKVAEALTMDSDTGSISVENVNTKSLNIRRDTGSLTLKNVVAEDDVVVKSTTGRNTFTDCTAKKITVSASTGNNKFTNTIVTEQLKVKASTGNVTFDHSDAGSIDVETSTGDITGSLITGKIFDAHSSTGKVSVPTGTTGGVAKLRTSTGRITITIVG